MSEMNIETPGDDAAEQLRDAADEEITDRLPERPFDVNEADAAEQSRDIGYGDDDYR